MSKIKSLYEPFQKWQNNGNIVLFSDPHWEDPDRECMKYSVTEKEQCDMLIKGINHGDTLICLGDVGNPEWMDYINTNRKHLHTVLITGNHDRVSDVKEWFDEIYQGPVMISPKIMLSHEPILSEYWFNVHGHCHSGARFDCKPVVSLKKVDKVIGINLAANISNYSCFNLNNYCNNGGLKDISSIHRIIIEEATLSKQLREDNNNIKSLFNKRPIVFL